MASVGIMCLVIFSVQDNKSRHFRLANFIKDFILKNSAVKSKQQCAKILTLQELRFLGERDQVSQNAWLHR